MSFALLQPQFRRAAGLLGKPSDLVSWKFQVSSCLLQGSVWLNKHLAEFSVLWGSSLICANVTVFPFIVNTVAWQCLVVTVSLVNKMWLSEELKRGRCFSWKQFDEHLFYLSFNHLVEQNWPFQKILLESQNFSIYKRTVLSVLAKMGSLSFS